MKDIHLKNTIGEKEKNKKMRINLSVSSEGWDKGKETAKALNKSLSQFTEDMWIDLNENFFGLSKSPQERLKHFKEQIKEMEDIYKNKLKEDNN